MIAKDKFGELGEEVLTWMESYYREIESFPVQSQSQPGEILKQLPACPPSNPEQFQDIFKDFKDIILPGITHWQHPNFHGYFPANSSIESVFAEMVSSTLGIQCMNWISSPAAAELEERMMEWLKEVLNLPTSWFGVIQDTASTASFAALLTAREVKSGFKANTHGITSAFRVYCSTEAHSSIEKAVRLSGIGSNNLVKIAVDSKQRMLASELDLAIEHDLLNGFSPCCVVAALGTTGTVAVDPIGEIGKICEKHKVWLHVDAAYAGTALMLPEMQWMAKGIERADSFVFNPHKWMFTNFDCTCYYVKNKEALIRTFEISPEYLKTGHEKQVNDYKDWGIPLGRRFRSLKLWFVIRSFGIEGLKKRIREHISLNEWFADQVVQDEEFELLAGPNLNFTGFRFKPLNITNAKRLEHINIELLNQINTSGKLFLTHTKIEERYMIRFVCGQTYAELKHVKHALAVILENARKLVY